MIPIYLPHDHGQNIPSVLEQFPSPEEFQVLSDFFRQMGDGSRLRLFWILCHYEECVINLSAMMGMSSPAISHHLRQLRNSNLIISRREGKEVYYKAANTEQVRLLHQLVEQLISITCPGPVNTQSPEGELAHGASV